MGVQADLEKAAKFISSQTPFVNTVIANHGVQGPTVYSLPKDRTPTLEEMQKFILNTPMEDFNQTFMVNTTAVFYAFAAFMSLLDAGNKHPDSPGAKLGIDSQLVWTSSIGAMSKKPGMGYAYSASKAAANLMAKQLSTTMAPYHIRCNVFCPGIYPSDMSTVRLHENISVNVGQIRADKPQVLHVSRQQQGPAEHCPRRAYCYQ